DQIGDRHERVIAHWNVVPEQTIRDGFTVGVIAHHLDGVDRVEISANGGAWVTIKEPSINPRTKSEEYWTNLDLPASYNKPIQLRAIAYPTKGKPFQVAPIGNEYGKQDLTLYPYEAGEVIELSAGTHQISRKNLPDEGWLIIRAKPGLNRSEVIIDEIGKDWHSGRLKFENVTIRLGAGGSQLRGRYHSRDNGQHLWMDNCRVIGNGPKDRTYYIAKFWETTFFTGCDISDLQSVFDTGKALVRNTHVHDIYEDIFRVGGLYVNVTIEDVDRQPAMDASPNLGAPHPDVWQSQHLRDTIAQDITAIDNVNAQGFFPKDTTDVALVRLKIDTVGSFRSLQMMGKTSNVLIEDSKFYGSSNFRGSVLEGERMIIRDSTFGSSAPFLPHNWQADGIDVYPRPPLYD
ncbi:MAG: hypothetical protein AAF085_11415, partial [Planctomycetota bacterium]